MVQIVESTPYIFTGTCTEVKEIGYGGAEITFKYDKVYQGNIENETVILRSMYAEPFENGRNYLIFAIKSTSVFAGYEYYSVEALYCDGTLGSYADFISDATGTLNDVCRQLEECLTNHKYTGDYAVEGEYCKSEDISEIYDYSSDVLLVTVTGVFANESEDRTVYEFTTDKAYKGGIDEINKVVAEKNSLENGKQYILLLVKADDDSLFYVISSKNSVILPDSDDAKILASK